MEQVPKIVQQRLRTTAKPGAHPDANVLAAFSEKLLSEPERTQLLGHLAECGVCREAVVLANAKQNEGLNPSPLPAGSRWLTRPVLRWGALAACVVVVGTAVTLHYGRGPEFEHRAAEVPSTPPAPRAASPATSSAASSDTATFEERDSLQLREKLAMKSPPPALFPGSDYLRAAGKFAKQKQTVDAKSAAIASAPRERELQELDAQKLNGQKLQDLDRLETGPTGANQPARSQLTGNMNEVVISEDKPKGVGGEAAGVPPLPASASNPTVEPTAKARNDAQNDAGRTYSQTITVQAEAVPVQTSQASVARAKDEAGKKARNARAGALAGAALGDRKADMNPAEVASGQSNAELRAATKTGTRWTIAADGALQHSFDAGRTWQTVPVAANAVFRALAVNDFDIWAGGNAGVLYHSSDGGQHWTQVKPQVDGRAVAGDIIAVEFGDPQHGKLTTSRHETWTTSDAGQTWQVE